MPKPISQEFAVIRRSTGQEVKNVFAIDPTVDPHARAALLAYARSAEDKGNYQLAMDLRTLVTRLEQADRDRQQQIAGVIDIPDWLLEMDRNRQSDNDSESHS